MNDNPYGSLFDEQNFAPQKPAAPQQAETAPENENANIELNGMLFEDIAVAGLTPMDLSVVSKMVNDKLKELERDCFEGPACGGIDTLRLSLLVSFYFASELYMLQQESGLAGKANAKRIDAVVERLQQTLKADKE